MASRIENFLAHLDHLSGGLEPLFCPMPSTKPGLDDITVIAYQNFPDGLATSFTYGLSLTDHPEWRNVRPELTISVRSDDRLWGLAVGHLAENLRGDCPFQYRDTIGFGSRISPESEMTAFLVIATTVLDRAQCRIDLSFAGHEGHDLVHLVGAPDSRDRAAVHSRARRSSLPRHRFRSV